MLLMKKSIILALISFLSSIVVVIIIQFSPIYRVTTALIIIFDFILIAGILFDYYDFEIRTQSGWRSRIPLNCRLLYLGYAWALFFIILIVPVITFSTFIYQVYGIDINELTSSLSIAIYVLWGLAIVIPIPAAILAKPLVKPKRVKKVKLKRKEQVCPKCGATKTPGYNFCQSCGEKFENE